MLRKDAQGRASFAVLALAILLFANMSVVYSMAVQRETTALMIQTNEIRSLSELSTVVDDFVETAAHHLAMQSIREATSGLHNQSEINGRFRQSFSDFMSQSFPRRIRGYLVSADDSQVIVMTESRVVRDVIMTGSEPIDHDEESPDSIQTGVPGNPEDAERVAYYHLMGFVNYTLSGEHTTLHARGEISSDLESPFPFIHQQMNRMTASGIGAASDIEEMLRYMLTTVAEQRILMGFAGGNYGKPLMGTYDVLTAQDIEMAVNIALLLEQLKLFRAVDDEAMTDFDAAYFSEYAGRITSTVITPSNGERAISRLIGGFEGSGTLDPADIFELFSAIDIDSIRMNNVMAQALYALADQYVLKYLDYLNFLPLEFLADLGLNIVEMAASAWDDFIGWITGNSKEAEMVRRFINDLFLDLGISPQVLATVQQKVPSESFIVANANGTRYNITVPPGSPLVPFSPKSILAGNGDLWQSYYDDIFKNDLNRLHAGIRDLAKDVANKIADDLDLAGLFQPIMLNGIVDPHDNRSILEYARERMIESVENAMTTLRSDPDIFSSLVGNLWVAEKETVRSVVDSLKSNYDMFADPASSVMFARDRLRDWVMTNARSDVDYDSLDSTGIDDLRAQVLKAIDGDGLARSAYDTAKLNDFARFEALYQKAISIDTPPEDGGLYRRMMESLTGSTGLLLQAGCYLRRFMEGLMKNEGLSDGKVLVPVSTQPFVFRNSFGNNSGFFQEETLVVDQSPDLLAITRLTRGHGVVSDLPREGDLFVDILDPSETPSNRDSPNTHLTEAFNASARPFESQWTISLRGLLRMRVSTSRGVYLDENGMVPATDEGLVPLDVVVRVKTFSGWPLDGVAYASSSTLGEDLWDAVSGFLDRVWNALSSAYGWILDVAKFIVHQLRILADFLIGQAAKVLEGIQRGVDRGIHLLQEGLKGTVSHLLGALDALLSKLPRFEWSLSILGVSLHLCVNCEPASRLMLWTDVGPLSINVRFVNLRLAGYEPIQDWAEWDVLVDIEAEAGPLEAHVDIDPLMLINEHILAGSGTWGGRWRFHFEGPVAEQYYSVSQSIGLTIPTLPELDAEVELGFKLKTSEPLGGVELGSLLEDTLRDAKDDCRETALNLENFKVCVEAIVVGFTDHFLEAVDNELHKILEVEVFFKGGVRAVEIASGGFELDIVVEGEGVLTLFHWLSRNVRLIVQRLFNSETEVHLESVPLDVIRHLFIFIGFYLTVGPPYMLAELFPDGFKPEATATWLIGANLPLAAALLGADLGPWEIRFGVVFEGPAAFPALSSGKPGMVTDLWALQGTVAPF